VSLKIGLQLCVDYAGSEQHRDFPKPRKLVFFGKRPAIERPVLGSHETYEQELTISTSSAFSMKLRHTFDGAFAGDQRHLVL
jgi:hypothetical protein